MRRFKTTLKFSTNFVTNTAITGNTEKNKRARHKSTHKTMDYIMFDMCDRASLNRNQSDSTSKTPWLKLN